MKNKGELLKFWSKQTYRAPKDKSTLSHLDSARDKSDK